MSRYVLDSFGVLASYWREPGARRFGELLGDPQNEFSMSIINLGEVYYRIAREESMKSADQALLWIGRFPIRFVDVDWLMTREAATIKSRYPLSYADCFAAVLSQQLGAALVSGDPEFERLEAEGVVSMEWLPYKPKASS